MPKTKSRRQVGYLLSSGSPLTDKQKAKLKRELHTGTVRVATNTHVNRSRKKAYFVT